jgi:hypothetical protein
MAGCSSETVSLAERLVILDALASTDNGREADGDVLPKPGRVVSVSRLPVPSRELMVGTPGEKRLMAGALLDLASSFGASSTATKSHERV